MGEAERGRGGDRGGHRAARHVRRGGSAVGPDERARRRQGSRARSRGRDADVLRSGRGVRAPQVRERLRPARVRSRRGPSRLRRSPSGARGDARAPTRLARSAHLPARPARRARRGEEDVEASGRRRLSRRASRHDRSGRRALVPRLARSRPDDGDRRRPGCREDAEEPGLLRPVRACPNRRNPAQRRRIGACN